MHTDVVDGVATDTSVGAIAVAVISPQMVAVLVLSSRVSTPADVHGVEVNVVQVALQRPEFAVRLTGRSAAVEGA